MRFGWYVLSTKPRKEEYAAQRLAQRGVKSFLPRIREALGLGGIKPLFPGYLFVQAGLPEEYYRVVWTPGVKRFVAFGAEPVPLGEEIVEFLRDRAGSSGVIVPQPTVCVGQEVRVTKGPLEGLVGIVERPPDARGRVKVLMSLLRRQVKVGLPATWVRGESVARL